MKFLNFTTANDDGSTYTSTYGMNDKTHIHVTNN